MNTYVKIVLIASVCVAVAEAQYDFGFDYSDGFLPSFGVPSYEMISSAAARDPRANRGPVVFPPSPPSNPSDTSGVIVGASGYGFVPPSAQDAAFQRFFYQGFYLR